MQYLGITASYDTAKPQTWMDEMVQCGFDRKDLYENYVWLYDEQARIHGRPFNIGGAYAKILHDYMEYVAEKIMLMEEPLTIPQWIEFNEYGNR